MRSSSPEDPENSAADSVRSPEVTATPVVAPPRTPAVEVSRTLEPKEETEPTEALKEEKGREITDQTEDVGDDSASPCGGGRGGSLARVEEITPSDCAPLGCQGGGGSGSGGGDCANGWTDAAEKREVVDWEADGREVGQGRVFAGQRSPDSAEVKAGVDDGESKGDAPPSSRVDLGMEDGWFQKLEAKMGAIKKQVRVRCCVRYL